MSKLYKIYNEKQSSVEWLISRISEILGDEICNKLTIEQTNKFHYLDKQAKAMQKKQIIDFAEKAVRIILNEDIQNPVSINQLYDETFKNNENELQIQNARG